MLPKSLCSPSLVPRAELPHPAPSKAHPVAPAPCSTPTAPLQHSSFLHARAGQVPVRAANKHGLPERTSGQCHWTASQGAEKQRERQKSDCGRAGQPPWQVEQQQHGPSAGHGAIIPGATVSWRLRGSFERRAAENLTLASEGKDCIRVQSCSGAPTCQCRGSNGFLLASRQGQGCYCWHGQGLSLRKTKGPAAWLPIDNLLATYMIPLLLKVSHCGSAINLLHQPSPHRPHPFGGGTPPRAQDPS